MTEPTPALVDDPPVGECPTWCAATVRHDDWDGTTKDGSLIRSHGDRGRDVVLASGVTVTVGIVVHEFMNSWTGARSSSTPSLYVYDVEDQGLTEVDARALAAAIVAAADQLRSINDAVAG